MKSYLMAAAFLTLTFLQSCSSVNTKKNTEFWVAGYKTEASNGAGKTETLRINKNDDYKQGNWENFYAPIEGFTFEPGYLKKIKLKAKHLDKKNIPADVSSIQYTLKKEITKIPDSTSLLQGNWLVVKLNNHPVNRMLTAPTLQFNLSQMLISGNDGCNNYTAKIKNLQSQNISFGMVAATKKACINKNISTEYYQALQNSVSYQFQKKQLKLLDSTGNPLLTFIKK